MKITKQMSASHILSINPNARSILKEAGIRFAGVASPLDSLEKIAAANKLGGRKLDELVLKLNEQPEMKAAVSISISRMAQEKLKKLLEAKKGKIGFRLRLASSGCGVYTYDFGFAEIKTEGDIEVDSAGLKILISKKHIHFLNGLRINFDKRADGFTFENPNLRGQLVQPE